MYRYILLSFLTGMLINNAFAEQNLTYDQYSQMPYDGGGVARNNQSSNTVQAQVQEQIQGNYGSLDYSNLPKGAIQSVWNNNNGKQSIKKFTYNSDLPYKIRLRENMATLVNLPEDIIQVMIGQQDIVNYNLISNKQILLSPQVSGMDTNMIIISSSGTQYVFYLRTEGYTSKNIPDLVYTIERNKKPQLLEVEQNISGQKSVYKENIKTNDAPKDTPKTSSDELSVVKTNLYFNFDIYAPTSWFLSTENEEHKYILPNKVFTDGTFTYLDYRGKKIPDILATQMKIVLNDIPTLVNFRVVDGFVVVSGVGLIQIQNGDNIYCIEFKGTPQYKWYKPNFMVDKHIKTLHLIKNSSDGVMKEIIKEYSKLEPAPDVVVHTKGTK